MKKFEKFLVFFFFIFIFFFVFISILGVETVIIGIFSIFTGDYNQFQLLVATYFPEYIGLTVKDTKKKSKKAKNRIAKYSFWRRMENLVCLLICMFYILFDNKYHKNNQTIILTKILRKKKIISLHFHVS